MKNSSGFFRKLLKTIVITIAVIIVVVVSLLPFVVRWQAVNWLEQQGLDAEIGYINIRPILGSVQINDVRIAASETEQLVLDKIQLNIDWTPLFDQELYVEHVIIDGLSIDAVSAQSGLRIGGITLPGNEDTSETKPEPEEPAGGSVLDRLMLERFELENIQLCYTQLGDGDAVNARQCLAFDELAIVDDIDVSWGTQASAKIPGIQLKALRWFDQKEVADLLWIDLLKITDITSEDLARWQIAEISVESLGVLPTRVDDEITAGDLKFSTLSVTDLDVGGDNSIGNIALSGLNVDLNLHGKGEAVFSPRLMTRIEQLVPPSDENTDEEPKNNSAFSLGQLVVDRAAIRDGGNNQQLLSFNNLNLQKLSIRDNKIGLSKVSISDAALLPVISEQGATDNFQLTGDLQLKSLSLSDLNVGDDSSIGSISLSGVKVDLQAGEDGELAFAPQLIAKLEQLSEPPVSEPSAPEQATDGTTETQKNSSAFSLGRLSIDTASVRDRDNNQRLLSFNNFSMQQLSIRDSITGLGELKVSNFVLLPVISEQGQTTGDLQLNALSVVGSSFGDDSHIGTLDLSGIHVGLDTAANGQLVFAPELLERIIPASNDSVPESKQQETSFSIDQLVVNDTLIRDKDNQRNLLLINQVDLSGLSTKGDAVALARLGVEDLKLLEPLSEDTVVADYYFSTPKIELTDIIKNASLFSLKELIVADPVTFVHRNVSGELQALSEIDRMIAGDGKSADNSAGNNASSTNEQAEPSGSVRYSIGRINIGSKGKLSVLDESVAPVFKRSFNELSLTVDNIDSSSPEAKSALSFNLGLTKFGHIKFDGTLTPFGEKLNTNIVGELRGLDARALSTYASDYIGYNLDQGIAEADINFDVNEDDLNAAIITRFRKLEVSALSDSELPEGAESLGMPLDFALGLLRDKNGMIELKLPITGDINSPNFSISHILGKVMFKVISETIVNYYLPFGLIMAATMQDTLSNFSFDPVVFSPGDVALDNEDMASLDKLSEMLNSREQLHLSFCAPSTWQDWSVKFGAPITAKESTLEKSAKESTPEEADSTQSNASQLPAEPLVEVVVTPEQAASLKEIANQRSEAVKEHLINKGVQTGQVILCEGQFDQTNKELPQMNIAI